MSLSLNEIQNSCEAESLACRTPARRRRSQRFQGSQNEPANDSEPIPSGKTSSLSDQVRELDFKNIL